MAMKSNRFLSRSITAGLLFSLLAFPGGDAEAHGRRFGRRGPGLLGAAIVGAVIGAALSPPVEAQVYYPPPVYRAPPPPPVYRAPPAYSYGPPPATVYAGSPVEYERPPFPRLGLAFMGTVQAGLDGLDAVGGGAGILELRTSSHSLLALELQSVGAHTVDDRRRNDLSALLGGRVFLWDAALAPYLELAGGFGRTVISQDGYYRDREVAAQFLGRLGLGIELRLGEHLVFNAQIARLHRWRLDGQDGPLTSDSALASYDGHERATEIRGGIGIRF
jgi:hypothetical protein